MASLVTNKFRVHNAQQFVESFSENANTVIYLGIGQVTPFPDDNTPPTPNNTVEVTEYGPWNEMYAAKRILTSDVTHAIPRYSWSSGTVYTQYDDKATNLTADDFYVITDDFHVFKCLFNNGGTASTTKPTLPGTLAQRFTTADGYVWRYMYTVGTTAALKFLTNDYIPVETLTSDNGSNQWTVQTGAVDGSIEVVLVTGGGSSYASAPTVTIEGDGTGATATANVGGGVVTSVEITNVGSGYTRASIVFDNTGTGGSGATARAIISPKGGHGHDAVEELGGKFVIMNSRLDGNEANTFSTSNEFRQVTVLRDPFIYGTTDRSLAVLQRQTYRYTLSGVSGTFQADELVTDAGSNSAVVVEWDSTASNLFTKTPLNLEFANGSLLTGNTSGATGTISVVSTPGLEPYTGDILYVENRVPIARADDQIEDIKLIIQF
jgi:hypothetical protein